MSKTTLMVGVRWVLAMGALAGLLAGCDSGPESGAAETGKTPAAAAAAAREAEPGKDMVSAVSSAKDPGLVNVKFDLGGRPVLGETLEIHLMLIPQQDIDKLVARFQGSPALELMNEDQTASFDKPAKGTGIPHTLQVVPRKEGVSYITVTVVADSLTQSIARQYSIPVIVPAAEPATAEVTQGKTAAGT
ncbi:MAG TPA: hypothetical protein VIL32_07925 [Steroidobacteraceae bacterium]